MTLGKHTGLADEKKKNEGGLNLRRVPCKNEWTKWIKINIMSQSHFAGK